MYWRKPYVLTPSCQVKYSNNKKKWLNATHFALCLFFFHTRPVSSLYFALPFSTSPTEPAAKFHPFQEQWEALTSEEQSEWCLSDKEVCRSHGVHTATALFTDMLCFCLTSLRWLVACQSSPLSWSLLVAIKSQLIYTLQNNAMHHMQPSITQDVRSMSHIKYMDSTFWCSTQPRCRSWLLRDCSSTWTTFRAWTLTRSSCYWLSIGWGYGLQAGHSMTLILTLCLPSFLTFCTHAKGFLTKCVSLFFRMMQHTALLEPVKCQVSPLKWASTIFLRSGLEMKRLNLSYSQSNLKYHQALFSRVHLE